VRKRHLIPAATNPISSELFTMLTNQGRPARLHYMAGTFRVLAPGDHVICAVTQRPIKLADLRYWNIARQEAYASAEASVKAEGKG